MIDNEGDFLEVNNASELLEWQKQLIDERLNDYYLNPIDIMDFDKTIDDIEKSF